MTTSTARTATAVMDHDLRSGRSRLLPIAIPAQSATANFAFSYLIIATLRSPSNLDNGCIAPVGTRLERPPSSSNHLQQFFKSLSYSSLNDDEPTSNTAAEYQEWPMHGFI